MAVDIVRHFDTLHLSTERFPHPENVIRDAQRMTRFTATHAFEAIRHIQAYGADWDKTRRVELIDGAATRALRTTIDSLPYRTHVVGSEGGGVKEIAKHGKEMPHISQGTYGHGYNEVDQANDPLEGTTVASKNEPGATSVTATSDAHSIKKTPEGIGYMRKLIAPPRAHGRVSLTQSPLENMQGVAAAYNLKPHEVHVVVLDRPRNKKEIDAIHEFGAVPHLITAGDLLPSILATTEPGKYAEGAYIVMGSGGWEEGIIAAVAARAQTAVMEAQAYSENAVLQAQHSAILTLDELASGKPEHSVVSVSAVTYEPWFKLQGVTPHPGIAHAYAVDQLTITSHGIDISRDPTRKFL